MKTKFKDKNTIPVIISEMTLEEKLTLLTGSTAFRGGKNEAHGIPAPLFLDGGTGFNTLQAQMEAMFAANEEVIGTYEPEELTAPLSPLGIAMEVAGWAADEENMTENKKLILKRAGEILDDIRPADSDLGCFPPGMFFGATMNPEVIERCGEALGREASACHIDVLLGTPNVNLHRDPRNGRLFEGYSEDPYIVSRLAPSFVRGVQSAGVAANVKHFAANNQETDRMGVNEIISERALRELYLPGFKACVEAGCKTVMSAYNSINGVPCAQNSWLLKKVLRDEWKFTGFVMSDWGAVYNRTEGIKNGNDVTMPGPREIGSLIQDVAEGNLSEEMINEACENYLNILLEMPVMKGQKYTAIDSEYSMDAAYAAACEGITLLKNNGILPLKQDRSIAFYGYKSKKFTECGAGSAEVITRLSTNMYDSSISIIGEENVTYEEITESTDVVVVTIGANGGEGADRINMEMEPEDKEVLEKAISDAKAFKKPVILILNVSAPVELMNYVDDVDAVLCVYLPGMAGGRAAADILFGRVNPSGKLPITFPKYYKDTPTYLNFPGENQSVTYGEGIYVGYRYYDKKEVEPLFPFGYGLSYTTFELSCLKIPEEVYLENENVEVSLTVKNIGAHAGAEVVQLYIHDEESALDRPVKELKGFKKVYLQPGESKTIQMELTKESLSGYDTKLEQFVTEPGIFDVLVGTSSRDIALKGSFEAVCQNPYGISEDMEIAKFVVETRALEVMRKYLPELDLVKLAGSYVVFQPFMTFREIWKQCVAPTLRDLTLEEKVHLYDAILHDLKKLG